MKIHIVQKGDTLWKISKKYGVPFESVKSANQQLANPDLIMPGMKINIPSSSAAQINKKHPVKETQVVHQPSVKEQPKPVKEQIQKEVKKPPAKEAPVMPAPQPTYNFKKTNMNVNVYKKPSYKPIPAPPAAPQPPKAAVKEKKPLPPKEAVKPKAVEQIPKKKKPEIKPHKKPEIKPAVQQPVCHWYPVGPVMHGCISPAHLCQCYGHNMHHNPYYNHVPQPYPHMPAMHHNHNMAMFYGAPNAQHQLNANANGNNGYIGQDNAGYGDITFHENNFQRQGFGAPNAGMNPYSYQQGYPDHEEENS